MEGEKRAENRADKRESSSVDAAGELQARDGCSTSSPAATDNAAVTHCQEMSSVPRLSTVAIRSACSGVVSTISVDHPTENKRCTTSPCHIEQLQC